MQIRAIPVGPYEVNCYVAWGREPRALVVDPGEDAGRIRKVLQDLNLDVAAYLVTHGHADHVSGLADLCATHPAHILMHPDDAGWAFTEINVVPPYYPAPRRPSAEIVSITDTQELTEAALMFRVIATPGHTPGGVCFYFPAEKALFAGDTLFAGSVGRTDNPGGSARVLSQSLARLVRLPDDTTVYPGHGPQTTLGEEKQSNFFLRRKNR